MLFQARLKMLIQEHILLCRTKKSTAKPVQLEFRLCASTIINSRHFHDVLTRLRWCVHWAVCQCSLTSAITAVCLTSNCPSVLYQHTTWRLLIRNVTYSLFFSVWYPSKSFLYNHICCFNRLDFSLAISAPFISPFLCLSLFLSDYFHHQ